MDTLKDVRLFHKLFNHPILETPTIPNEKRCILRIGLLSEEFKELQQAIEDNNIIEVADAFADIQYVLSGAILEFGLGDLFPSIFAEVQRSNMSKACLTEQEALDTIEHYFKLDGTIAHYVEKILTLENKEIVKIYLVIRTSDNKTLKSINYSPANLSFILNS